MSDTKLSIRHPEGFLILPRSDDALHLATAFPQAFILLYVIALRARRTNAFNQYNLKQGEALVGDCKACGMSERQYRTAKQVLQKFKFATFKATNKGTIAMIINTRVFDINADAGDEQKDEQPTDERRAGDEQATTNKNAKKEKKEKNVSATGRAGPPSLLEWINQAEKIGYTHHMAHGPLESGNAWLGLQAVDWYVDEKTKVRDWRKWQECCMKASNGTPYRRPQDAKRAFELERSIIALESEAEKGWETNDFERRAKAWSEISPLARERSQLANANRLGQ